MVGTHPLAHRLASWSIALLVAIVPTLNAGPVGAAPVPPSGFAHIGDSISWQATADLEAVIPGIRVRAEIGWNFNRGIEELKILLAGGTPSVLTVALGTNPPLTLAKIDEFMQLARDVEQVVFVNIRIPAEWEAPTNELLASLPGIYGNVSILDWNSYSNARPWVFNDSGYHLSDEGKPVFADFVAAGAYAAAGGCAEPTQTAPRSAGVGVVDPLQGFWYLRDPLTGDTTGFYYGNPGDVPFMGDWDGDGVDTPGLYRQSDGYVYLRNSNTQGVADIAFFFGNPGDVPIAGDFDGDGSDTVSIYRPEDSTFYLIDRLGSGDAGLGAADRVVPFGDPGDLPLRVGTPGGAQDTVGIFRDGLMAIANASAVEFPFGGPGDLPVAASWEGDEAEGIGVYRPSTSVFHLRSAASAGAAHHVIAYGRPGFLPVAGYFGDLPGGSDPPRPIPCGSR